jgi:hypothetical protein
MALIVQKYSVAGGLKKTAWSDGQIVPRSGGRFSRIAP